ERDVLAGHLEPLAQQGRLGDQGRGIAFEHARALRHELADLGLGAAGDDVAVALLDQLDAALEGLGRRRPAHREIGHRERSDDADQDDPQKHSCRLSTRGRESPARTIVTPPWPPWASTASTSDCRRGPWRSPQPWSRWRRLPRWRGSRPSTTAG